MFMKGTINMEMNGPCKYMYMYFWGKKDLCTVCMMGFWNIYAMPHVHVFRQITLQKILTRRSKILLKTFTGTIFTGNRDICLSLFGSYILQFLYQ